MSAPHVPVAPWRLEIVRKYEHLLNNTGGNPAADLLLDLQPYEDGRPNRIMGTNVVRFVLATAVLAQVDLLARLEQEGVL